MIWFFYCVLIYIIVSNQNGRQNKLRVDIMTSREAFYEL